LLEQLRLSLPLLAGDLAIAVGVHLAKVRAATSASANGPANASAALDGLHLVERDEVVAVGVHRVEHLAWAGEFLSRELAVAIGIHCAKAGLRVLTTASSSTTPERTLDFTCSQETVTIGIKSIESCGFAGPLLT
jgi:hypothetical protein